MKLNDEQKEELKDALKREDRKLSPEAFQRLVRDIEHSIETYQGNIPPASYDEAFRQLEILSRLVNKQPKKNDDLTRHQKMLAAKIREQVAKLNRRALAYLDGRFRLVMPTLGQEAFGEWANNTDDEQLIEILRMISSEGGVWVQGRTRGAGSRSRPRLAPVIMGKHRGIAIVKQPQHEKAEDSGKKRKRANVGRPRDLARRKLVMFLGLDWQRAFGEISLRGREEKTGFAALIHTVFGWLRIGGSYWKSFDAASNALKDFAASLHESENQENWMKSEQD